MRTRRQVSSSVSSPSILRTTSSIRVGRLVTNIRDPAQDFCDLPAGLVDMDDENQILVSTSLFPSLHYNTNTNTKLGAALTRLFSSSYKTETISNLNVVASEQRTYQLQNSEKVFRNACKDEEVREWLTNAARAGESVYMVVGYHTLIDPEIHESSSTNAVWSGGMDSSVIHNSEFSVSAAGAGRLEKNRNSTEKFCAEGERLWAVQYRKVVIKSTKKAIENLNGGDAVRGSNSSISSSGSGGGGGGGAGKLLKDNQWEVLWRRRTAQKTPQQYILQAQLDGGDTDELDDDEEGGSEEEQSGGGQQKRIDGGGDSSPFREEIEEEKECWKEFSSSAAQDNLGRTSAVDKFYLFLGDDYESDEEHV
ncbi:hypothetical protein DFH27DRAFT_542395 [Peziza echinospora]|nr:hypothetical protein DFH27DRAFT_542395 [Peziza echinospora]